MAEPFLAEVKMVGFNFAPRGWAFCDGQILPINQNQSLYSLVGTTYGGDGRTSFGLPDLRGRTPVHRSSTYVLGSKGGAESVALTVDQMPSHTHPLKVATQDATLQRASNTGDSVLAKANVDMYRSPPANTTLISSTISNTGGNQAHNNMQPSCVVNFCIALQGLFPSRN